MTYDGSNTEADAGRYAQTDVDPSDLVSDEEMEAAGFTGRGSNRMSEAEWAELETWIKEQHP